MKYAGLVNASLELANEASTCADGLEGVSCHRASSDNMMLAFTAQF